LFWLIRIVETLTKHSALRALVVGYGSIARRHVENLQACGAREVTILRPSGRPAGAAQSLRFVATLDEALAARPDCAVIASPTAKHGEALLPLIRAGVPVYVEKPVVMSANEVKQVKEELSRRAFIVTMTGCNLRFLPSLRRLQSEITAGAIGAPVRASLQAGQWLPDWRPARDYRETYSAKSAEGGGVVLDLIHEIDAARWLFGDFDQVLALGGKLSRLEIDAEDVACILLGRRGAGPVVAIGLDYVARQRVRRYEVIGEEGTLVWDLAARRLSLFAPEGERVLAGEAADFDAGATYLGAMREFTTAVREGGPASPDLADGLAAAELAIRARDALRA
jgi:predicted dehydrogenase